MYLPTNLADQNGGLESPSGWSPWPPPRCCGYRRWALQKRVRVASFVKRTVCCSSWQEMWQDHRVRQWQGHRQGPSLGHIPTSWLQISVRRPAGQAATGWINSATLKSPAAKSPFSEHGHKASSLPTVKEGEGKIAKRLSISYVGADCFSTLLQLLN